MAKDTKGKKNLILAAAIAFVVIVILIIVFLPDSRESGDGPDVISKKVKLDLRDDAVKADNIDENKNAAVEVAAPAAVADTKAGGAPPPDVAPNAEVRAPEANKPEEKKPEAVKEPVQSAPPAPVKKASTPREPAKPKVRTASVDKSALAASKPWVINIASFSHRDEADSLAKTLRAAGYNAYTTSFTSDGVKWTRVRVGFYSTKEDARKTGEALQKRYSLGSPWIVKSAPDETARHIR